MSVSDYFFQLIRVAVGKNHSLLGTPSVEEWMSIFTMSRQQALLGVMFSAIETLPRQQRPPSHVLLRWYAYAEKIKAQNVIVNAESVKVQRFFKNHGFASSVLKGQGVATIYPQPLLRMSGDIDIWVDGGEQKVVAFLRRHCKIDAITYHHVGASLSDKVEVEVHFRPTWMWNPIHNYRLQKWFGTQASLQMSHTTSLPSGNSIFAPTSDFNIVFLLIHIFRHLFHEGVGLRQIMDLYYVLMEFAQDPCADAVSANRANLCVRLRKLGLHRFAGAVMYVLRDVFQLDESCLVVEPDEAFGKFLLKEIMLAGNFGKYDKRLTRGVKVGTFANLMRGVRRNHKFLRFCPDEVVWEIPFKVWHYLWRRAKNNGYSR